MGQVQKHCNSVLEECFCLLLPIPPYDCGIKFIMLLWQAHKQQHDFGSEIMNKKISHTKGLQRTKPYGLDAQTSTLCTRTLCLPPSIPGGPSLLD